MIRAIELSMADIRSQEAQQFSTPSVTRVTPSSASSIYSEQSLPRTGSFALPPLNNQCLLSIRRPVERPSRLPTPTPSPPSRSNTFGYYSQSSKRPSSPSSGESDDELPSPPRRRKTSGVSDSSSRAESFQFSSQSSQSTISPTFVISDDDELPPPPRRRKSNIATGVTAPRHRPQQSTIRPSKVTSSGLSARQVFMRNGLSASAAVMPNEDIVEEDL